MGGKQSTHGLYRTFHAGRVFGTCKCGAVFGKFQYQSELDGRYLDHILEVAEYSEDTHIIPVSDFQGLEVGKSETH